jgi:AraC family transcriptional regulator, positive regulator of tynA and feaB
MLCPVRSFSTKKLPSASTLRAWHDYMEKVYYRVDVKVQNTESVRGELEDLKLGEIGISRFSADQQRVFRPKAAAAVDHCDNYVFIFPRSEKMYFQQRGKSGLILPGSVVILRSSEWYEASCPDNFLNVTIKVPTALLDQQVRAIDDLCATVGVGNPALVRIVSDMADELVSSHGELQAQSAPKLSECLTSLIAVMLDGDADEPSPQSSASAEESFRRICAYLRSHLGNADLNPLSVARSQSMSLRYLHRLFQLRGTTFGRWLIDERLAAARRLMEGGAGIGTIYDVALRCGFVSQAHFSTRYHEKFRERPRDTMERTRQLTKRD